MRLRSFGSLCAILVVLSAGCVSIESMREQKICAANPGLCMDGHLVAKRVDDILTIPLPDLAVENVNCSVRGAEVYMTGKVRNLGTLPTPGYINSANPGSIDISATVNPGTPSAQPFFTTGIGLAAMGQRGDNYQASVAPFPNADPMNFPLTSFQVYANPPQTGYPYGKFWESNLQNNYACGLCQCQNNSCTTTQTQQQCGPPQ